MSKSKTNKPDPKTPVVKPRIRGKCVQDRETGNWSRVPDEATTVKKPVENATS